MQKSLEEKLEIKRLGTHRPSDSQFINFVQPGFIEMARAAKNSHFCSPCFLTGGDMAWIQQGIVDLKHLSDKIRKHECSTSHIGNSVKLSVLGKANIPCQVDEGQCIAIQRHNELVKKNRHSLSWIVDCIKFWWGT